MKISRNWLQGYFKDALPEAQALADALTFHAFEIESVEQMGDDVVLDVKVTPNRGHDCLSHRGIAKELSTVLQLALNAENDPFAKSPDLSKHTDQVAVHIENPMLCKRYIAAYVRGIKVGPSPEWLRSALEAIGQRSINNVVDATNLVMFNVGQPLHAFDAAQLMQKEGKYSIAVRAARDGETMLALDDKTYTLSPSNLVIVDAYSDVAIGIAGVKGGKPAGVSETTTDIIIESANFDGVSVRKTAAALKLRTDASARFEQVISSELAAYGMQQVVNVIAAVAGGEVVGFVDEYPTKEDIRPVTVSLSKINAVLGVVLSEEEVTDVFTRLSFSCVHKDQSFTVTAPFQRLDIELPEDLIEEVGRIIGYDKVPATPLPSATQKPAINTLFYTAEKVREELMAAGYSEVFTSVFADSGKRIVANKVDGVRPYLRSSLIPGLEDALKRNKTTKDLLGLMEVKLFEIGTVWKEGKEVLMVGQVSEKEKATEKPLVPIASDHYDNLPISQATRYQSFSKYPYIVRDLSLWIPDTDEARTTLITQIFPQYSRGLLRNVILFDQYKKDGRNSLAFHLVFQSFEKTLTDEEANQIMADIHKAAQEQGFEIR